MGEEGIIELEMTQMPNGNEGAAQVNVQKAPTDEPDALGRRTNVPGTETEALLGSDATNGNGVVMDSNHDTEAHKPKPSEKKKSAVCKLKEELTQKVCGSIPLWAVLILIFVAIVGVIFASLSLCTVIYEDVDEKYDTTQFNVYRNFSGSFQLPNLNFTEELLDVNSSQTLTTELRNQLGDLYRHSPALGRYYFTSEVYDLSDDPVTAWFRLTFRMPAADESQLTRFTLSRGMVYNVLRQFLLDQEEDPSERWFIKPASLNMTE